MKTKKLPLTGAQYNALRILSAFSGERYSPTFYCSPEYFARQMWTDSPYKSRKLCLMAGSYVSKLVNKGWAEKWFGTRDFSFTGYAITKEGLAILQEHINAIQNDD